jgi:hypothetical protein
MKSMFHRNLLRLSVFVAGIALAVSSLHAGAQQGSSQRGRKYKVPPASARIEVTVLRDINGKPIENAAVVFHPMEGERDKGAMELKTNEDGKAVIDVIPIGDTVRLQIIARGFQTYGQDYKIDKSAMTMEIRMKRPGEQYSIYKEKDETADSGKGSGADKPANSSKDAAPPTGSKPSGSPRQPDSQPTPSQSQPQPN